MHKNILTLLCGSGVTIGFARTAAAALVGVCATLVPPLPAVWAAVLASVSYLQEEEKIEKFEYTKHYE